MEPLETRCLLSGVGQLDSTFGQGGAVGVDFGIEAYAAQVALQTDGKIVAVGGTSVSSTPDGDDWSIARVNANGSMDTSFGSNGKIIMDWGGAYDEAFSVVVQNDGKILIAGDVTINGNQNAAVIRLNTNGTLDSSFGNGGKVIVDFYDTPHDFYRTSDTFRQIRLDSQGRILLGGTAATANGNRMAVVRLNTNGTFDSTFGSGGKVILNSLVNQVDAQTEGMIIQSDGKIVLAGLSATTSSGSSNDYAIVRLKTNGALDSDGGSGGFVRFDWYNDWDLAWGVAQQADGKLVITGEIVKGGEYAIGTLRLNTDLTLDSSFGQGGKVLMDYNPNQPDVGRDVMIQPDGKILVVGRLFNRSSDAGIIRYNPNGTLDTSFGNGGTATFDLSGYFDSAEGLAIQPDGKIVIAGEERNGSKNSFGILRFIGVDNDSSNPDVPADPNATYLSDLSPTSATNGYGPYEKDMSNGEDGAGDGHTLTLNGVTYARGLGVHANSNLTFNLAGAYSSFTSDIGIDDEVDVNGSVGSVVFQVYADGNKIYDSGLMTGSSTTKSLSLNVAGVQQLKLVVTDGGNGIDFDHCDWANAQLSKTVVTPPVTSDPVYLSTLTPVSATNGYGPYEKDMSNGEDGAGDGHTLTLNGVTYARGLGVHANSSLTFNLNGGFSSFLADTGIDDEVGSNGSVKFQVLADGVMIYDSGLMTGTSATKSLTLNVAGTQQLTLVVTDGGNGIDFDHSDWANARLLT
jgi:uncharacterized delta-60 repeat protein